MLQGDKLYLLYMGSLRRMLLEARSSQRKHGPTEVFLLIPHYIQRALRQDSIKCWAFIL